MAVCPRTPRLRHLCRQVWDTPARNANRSVKIFPARDSVTICPTGMLGRFGTIFLCIIQGRTRRSTKSQGKLAAKNGSLPAPEFEFNLARASGWSRKEDESWTEGSAGCSPWDC